MIFRGGPSIREEALVGVTRERIVLGWVGLGGIFGDPYLSEHPHDFQPVIFPHTCVFG